MLTNRVFVGNILIVDNNAISSKFIRKLLNQTNFNVEIAEDGYDCLKKIEEKKDNFFDIIIVKNIITLNELSGLDIIKKIKQNRKTKDTIIIGLPLITNHIRGGIEMIEAGADDFLAMPIENALLLAKCKLMFELSQLRKEIKNYQ